MYEHKYKPLISRQAFFARMVNHVAFTVLVIGFSLLVGTTGYHVLAHLSWVDAFLNAAMILGGMGPVDLLPNIPAKLFAACYALYSGLILLVSVGILMAPIFHRLLHRFHLERKSDEREP